MHEPANGNPGLRVIRKVAVEICQRRDDSQLDELTIEDCVRTLCATRVRTRASELRWKEALRRTDDYTQYEYEELLFAAALCTNTLPYIQHSSVMRQRMLADFTGTPGTCLFGNYAELAAKYSNEQVLICLLISATPDSCRKLRAQLFELAAKAGRVDTVQFLYNFRRDEMPWNFTDKEHPEAMALDNILKVTYDPEVWGYIDGLRITHSKSATPIDVFTLKLYKCAWVGSLDMATYLLQINAHAEGSYSPFSIESCNSTLELACARGYVAIVELLLDHGVDPNITIVPAASRGHIILLQKLLERGIAPTNAMTMPIGDLRYGPARIFPYLEAGPYLDVVRLLLDAGIDPNESNGKDSPLAGAVASEHTALFEFLLKRGADLHLPETAEECVRRAKKDGLDSMLFLLRAHGVDVDKICNSEPGFSTQ
jgi:ankyrin repeat protein